MKKENTLYIGIGIALFFLYKYLNKKKTPIDYSAYQYLFQKNAPVGSTGIFLNMGGKVYNKNFEVIFTQLTNDFTGYTVISETADTYNVKFGKDYANGIDGIIFKSDVAK
jgi:hypothetical protein